MTLIWTDTKDRALMFYLPNVLVGEISAAESASVKATPAVNVLVLPHVVGRRVMFAADGANKPLLTVAEFPDAISLLEFFSCWRWVDRCFADDIVGVVVRNVMVAARIVNCR